MSKQGRDGLGRVGYRSGIASQNRRALSQLFSTGVKELRRGGQRMMEGLQKYGGGGRSEGLKLHLISRIAHSSNLDVGGSHSDNLVVGGSCSDTSSRVTHHRLSTAGSVSIVRVWRQCNLK